MKIYIVYDWIPFPSSEYGGMLIYTAENEQKVFDMMVENSGSYHTELYPDYKERIMKCLQEAIVFELTDPNIKAGLVASFTT